MGSQPIKMQDFRYNHLFLFGVVEWRILAWKVTVNQISCELFDGWFAWHMEGKITTKVVITIPDLHELWVLSFYPGRYVQDFYFQFSKVFLLFVLFTGTRKKWNEGKSERANHSSCNMIGWTLSNKGKSLRLESDCLTAPKTRVNQPIYFPIWELLAKLTPFWN